MVSLLRLRGRALYIGDGTVSFLIFFTALLIFITSNLLPVIYIRGISVYTDMFLAEYKSTVNLVCSVLILFAVFSFCFCISAGIKRYLFKKTQTKSARSEDIFYYFRPSRFFSCVGYGVSISLMRIFILISCLLPCFVCSVMVYRLSFSGVSALVCGAMALTAVLLFVNGIIFYHSFSSSFFLCDYYFVSGEHLGFRHLVASSQLRMKNNRKTLMKLRVSFIGWFLLGTLIFPIPFVWSYYNHCLAVAADDFMK